MNRLIILILFASLFQISCGENLEDGNNKVKDIHPHPRDKNPSYPPTSNPAQQSNIHPHPRDKNPSYPPTSNPAQQSNIPPHSRDKNPSYTRSNQRLVVNPYDNQQFHLGIANNDRELVREFIKQGADVNKENLISSKLKKSKTPIDRAVSNINLEIFKILVEGGAHICPSDISNASSFGMFDYLRLPLGTLYFRRRSLLKHLSKLKNNGGDTTIVMSNIKKCNDMMRFLRDEMAKKECLEEVVEKYEGYLRLYRGQ